MSILDNYYWEWKSIRDKITELEEENQTLKDKIEFLTNCLDDRDKSIELMKEENKNLKSEIENMKEVGRENIETLDRMSIELENYSKSFKRYYNPSSFSLYRL